MGSDPLDPRSERSASSAYHFVVLLVVAAAVLPLFGPQFVDAFRPPDGVYLDFLQEWLSARNYLSGMPVYTPQDISFPMHTGFQPGGANRLPYNAHPPAAVLLALPLAGFDYPTAHLSWNLLTFPLVPLCVGWTARELGRPLGWFGGGMLLVLGVACAPLVVQLLQAQLNPLLLLLLTVAWTADRRGYLSLAGAAVGVAAAVKLSPAFLFVYFAAQGKWRAILAGIVAFLAVNLVAGGVFGFDTFRDYIQNVLPTLDRYQRGWRNLSLGSIPLRLFDPNPLEKVDGWFPSPVLAAGLAWALRLLVTGVVAWKAFAARTPEERDRALALALVGLLLAAPITWNHYYLLLPLPLFVAFRDARVWRWPLFAALAVMWLPDITPYFVTAGPKRAAEIAAHVHTLPITLREHVLSAVVLHAPLVVLFGRLVRRTAAPAGVSVGGAAGRP